MEDYKRKYETAINQAKEELRACGDLDCDAARQIFRFFPELKESEDESVRQHLLKHFSNKTKEEWNGMPVKNIIAWLEKQDPKKHEEELEKAYKTADEVQYRKGYEDAKRKFEKQGEQKPFDYEHANIQQSEKYVADVFEKVGLAKIVREQSNDNLTNALQDAMIELSEFISQPKPAWDEEDEKMLNYTISTIKLHLNDVGSDKKEILLVKEEIDWLKSLKEKMKENVH